EQGADRADAPRDDPDRDPVGVPESQREATGQLDDADDHGDPAPGVPAPEHVLGAGVGEEMRVRDGRDSVDDVEGARDHQQDRRERRSTLTSHGSPLCRRPLPRGRLRQSEQTPKMDRLTYVGHGTTLLRLGELSILTDPFLRNWLGPLHRHGPRPDRVLPEVADLVLISHIHPAHLDGRSLRRLPPTTPLVVPRGARRWAERGGAEEIREVDVGETLSFGTVEVTAVKALHNGYRDRTWGDAIQPLGYLIEAGGRTTYFAGDTDLFAEMS